MIKEPKKGDILFWFDSVEFKLKRVLFTGKVEDKYILENNKKHQVILPSFRIFTTEEEFFKTVTEI